MYIFYMKGKGIEMEIKGTGEKQNKLSELISRIQNVAVEINKSSNSLDCLTDKIIGSRPEVASDSEKVPLQQGIIGKLEDVIGTLQMRSIQMGNSVNRLIDSEII